MDDYGYKAEYAKSNRAACKLCKSNIGKDSLRMAVMVQSPMFDGKIPNWHHYACFWKRARVANTTEVHGFDALRWEDQEKIKSKIGGSGGGEGASGASNAGLEKDYCTEYAKSNRSACRVCEDKINKDEIRISRKDYESERAKMYGPQDQWHHVDCFVEKRDDLGFSEELNIEKITGFSRLSKEDKVELKSKLGTGKPASKKRKADSKTSDPAEKKAKQEETAEQKALKEQSKLLWTARDRLQKEVSTEALKGLLEWNSQALATGESRLLDAVADCMTFGALDPCPECKEGQLVYSSSGCYKCTGDLTEWTKCMYVSKTPKRRAFKVPKEYHDVDFLKKYKYVPRVRVFPSACAANAAGQSGATPKSGKKRPADKPLHDMKFVIVGKLKLTAAKTRSAIEGYGGVVQNHVDSSVLAVISNTDEVKKMKKSQLKQAKAEDIHVVADDFLSSCSSGDVAELVVKHSIAPWGSDVGKRIGDTMDGAAIVSKSLGKSLVSKRDEKMFTKVPDKMKMLVKGGAAVDPDSGLSSSGHIAQQGKDVYNAVLGLVDIVRGTNSFYKLQVIELDKSASWYVFRAWGRVGTTIGGNKLERKGSLASAVLHFKELYAEKTGNLWEDRASFRKLPNKFYPLEMDYGEDEASVGKLDMKSSSSKLAKPVQDLVCRIFDIESMKKTMMEFEIDLKKMPLGKLSRSQIEKAYKVLNELNTCIEADGSMGKLVDLSNKFYTLIPHDFGMQKPTILDQKELINTKTEMLDNLLDIELAYSMLKDAKGGSGVDPIDLHYQKLKTDIKVMDKSSAEYARLLDYVKNTHAATHASYELDVLEVFEVCREGEYSRFRPFEELHNRQLLWHGSRTTNYGGILSQGLRIAPPEAPVTGYMFGKGVYFADMVSKSANYCRASKSEPTVFLLLCEVALGDMYELTAAKFISSLPKGKHSTKGMGMTTPDPKGFYTTEKGVVIPMGRGVSAPIKHSSLLYNEYIVYDVAQINIKYMLKVNFKFKW